MWNKWSLTILYSNLVAHDCPFALIRSLLGRSSCNEQVMHFCQPCNLATMRYSIDTTIFIDMPLLVSQVREHNRLRNPQVAKWKITRLQITAWKYESIIDYASVSNHAMVNVASNDWVQKCLIWCLVYAWILSRHRSRFFWGTYVFIETFPGLVHANSS